MFYYAYKYIIGSDIRLRLCKSSSQLRIKVTTDTNNLITFELYKYDIYVM